MNNGKTIEDVKCELHQFERNRYFYGKLMTVRDFEAEQRYVREHRHLHNQSLHGWGVVCGLTVEPKGGTGNETKVVVKPGIAIDCCGSEIVLANDHEIDLSKDPFLSKIGTVEATGKTVYLCIEYYECDREPVPALSNVSTCEEVCKYNRIQEKVAFDVMAALPDPVQSETCETWMNLISVQSDIEEGEVVIAEFGRITPRWVRQGDVFEVHRKIKALASGKTIRLEDTLPSGFSLVDGSLAMEVANTIEGKIVQSSHLVKVSNAVSPGKYQITGQILQSMPEPLSPSEIEVIPGTKPLEQQVQEKLFEENFKACPRCADALGSRCAVLARIALQQQGSSFIVSPTDDAIDNVVFDEAKGIHRRLVYHTPLIVDLLECLKKQSKERLGPQINVKDDNVQVVSAANSLNFLGGIDAVDGDFGQANISANVGNGLKIAGDQIQLDSHHATHEDGGSDEMKVDNLSGVLADAQKVTVLDEDSEVATRSQLNFIGAGVTASADALNEQRININIPGGAVQVSTGLVIFQDVRAGELRVSSPIKHGLDVNYVAIVMAVELKSLVYMGDLAEFLPEFPSIAAAYDPNNPNREFLIGLRDRRPVVGEPLPFTWMIRWWAIPKTQDQPDVVVPREGPRFAREFLLARLIMRPGMTVGDLALDLRVEPSVIRPELDLLLAERRISMGEGERLFLVSELRERITEFIRITPRSTLTTLTEGLGVELAVLEPEVNRLVEEGAIRRGPRGTFTLPGS